METIQQDSSRAHRRRVRRVVRWVGAVIAFMVVLVMAAFVVFKSIAIEAYVQDRALPALDGGIAAIR
jgi:hypothetical protein